MCAALNRFLEQRPTKWLLYGHLPPISQTIQKRQVKPADHN